MAANNTPAERPASDQIREELLRIETRSRFSSVMRNTFAVLVSVAAVAVLIATLVLPVLRVYGNAMTNSIKEGEILISYKTRELKRGDVIALYYNNRILVRRVIGIPGDVIEIDQYGNIKLNGHEVAEGYVTQRIRGTCDIEFPFLVPDGSWFVLGDNRLYSIDSRSSVVGCIKEDQLLGKIFACIWPFQSMRWIGQGDILFLN